MSDKIAVTLNRIPYTIILRNLLPYLYGTCSDERYVSAHASSSVIRSIAASDSTVDVLASIDRWHRRSFKLENHTLL